MLVKVGFQGYIIWLDTTFFGDSFSHPPNPPLSPIYFFQPYTHKKLTNMNLDKDGEENWDENERERERQ